ncbi:MAG TPA: hypothetical protein VLE72_03345 [Candidatus Saccharimonadales bacterium]|nr:hypothetical protein [Candidatus Saccharimonadales bacterium]
MDDPTKIQNVLCSFFGFLCGLAVFMLFLSSGIGQAQTAVDHADQRWQRTSGTITAISPAYGNSAPNRRYATVTYPSGFKEIKISSDAGWHKGDHLNLWVDSKGIAYIPADARVENPNPFPNFAGRIFATVIVGLFYWLVVWLVGWLVTYLFLGIVLHQFNRLRRPQPATS